jgi:hypothetical protein
VGERGTTPLSTDERVERDARRIVSDAAGETGVIANIARELALALNALEGSRALHEWQRAELLADECAIETDLAKVTHLAPGYSPAEARLRSRLLALRVERRALAATHATALAAHYRLLLELVQRYRVLDPPDEH